METNRSPQIKSCSHARTGFLEEEMLLACGMNLETIRCVNIAKVYDRAAIHCFINELEGWNVDALRAVLKRKIEDIAWRKDIDHFIEYEKNKSVKENIDVDDS